MAPVRWLALLLLLLLPGRRAAAQLDPSLRWRTLVAPHVRVHYPSGLDLLARRAVVHAESAWVRLARELVPPRGPVDVVVADNVDFTNGFATIFPSNRIVVYAQPPLALPELRFHEDWLDLVITHELLHLFHLDRSRGWWRLAQRVVGRNPGLFPNAYQPSWVKEGLAIHYESKLTGAGRAVGTDFPMIARAAAAEGAVPRSTDWSLATTQFPLGQTAYAWGAQQVERLVRGARDSAAVRRFVDGTAGFVLPAVVDRAARRAFGTSIGTRFRAWRDSLLGAAVAIDAGAGPTARAVAPGDRAWRPWARADWRAALPRFADDSTLLVAMQPARQMPGVYRVAAPRDGGAPAKPVRVGRRNSLDVNVPLADGAVLFAQWELVDPFTVRSDLWLDVGGRERRLTHAARLSHPDVPRGDGRDRMRIVAVQAVDGTSRLVRVRVDAAGDARAAAIVPLTGTHPDTQWVEPRWAPDGARLAAVRLTRGGLASVVVLDSTGRPLIETDPVRAVIASPAWDGDAVLVASDWSGASQLHRVHLDRSGCAGDTPCRVPWPRAARPVSAVHTGLFQPDVAPGGRVAALRYRLAGHEVVTSPAAAPVGELVAAPHYAQRPRVGPGAPRDSSVARAYAPWRTLRPFYWTPLIGQSGTAAGGTTLGLASSGEDVVGRHQWSAALTAGTGRADLEGSVSWRYRGFGQPFVDVSGTQGYDYFPVFARRAGDSAVVRAGELRRVSRIASAGLTVVRPGYRRSASLTLAASLEQRDFATDPAPLVDRLDPLLRTRPRYPAMTVSGAWTTVQEPGRAVSLEDGVWLTASAQRRWREGAAATTGSTRLVAVARGYKSLPLPGYARHVVAARVAGAWNDARASSDVSLGGTSGQQVEVLPGLVLGDPARSFAVRGFAPGAQRGLSAVAASAEYRAPLVAITRGMGRWPLFVDRASVNLFADAGRAWCPAGDGRTVCAGLPPQDDWLGSVGGEVALATAVGYDVPYRLRAGVARPVRAPRGLARGAAVYITLGAQF